MAFGILAHRKKHYLHVRTRPLRRKFRADSENGPKKFRAVVERSRFWRVRIKFDIPPALRKNNPKFIDRALRSEFGIWPYQNHQYFELEYSYRGFKRKGAHVRIITFRDTTRMQSKSNRCI